MGSTPAWSETGYEKGGWWANAIDANRRVGSAGFQGHLGCRSERPDRGARWKRDSVVDDSMGAELHDRVISGLTALLVEMEQFKREQYNRSGVQSSVTGFQDSMRTTMAALREVVHELQGSPPELERGLVEGITHGPLAEVKARTGANTKMLVSPRWPKDLGWAMTMQLYRVIEQALQNVSDHSGARNVTVGFEHTGNRLIVEVSDDGVGLPLATSVQGQGMRSMNQRALVLGGSLEVRNRRRGGVVVQCAVPLPSQPLAASDG